MNSLEDELHILESIYNNHIKIDYENKSIMYMHETEHDIFLNIQIPKKYPNKHISCEVLYGELTDIIKDNVARDLITYSLAHVGENILFDLINRFNTLIVEHLKNRLSICKNLPDKADVIREVINYVKSGAKIDVSHSLQKISVESGNYDTFYSYDRPSSPIEDLLIERDFNASPPILKIFQGEKVKLKKSIFQAHFTHISKLEDIETFKNELLNDKNIANATHNIVIYKLFLKSKFT